jgi:hypothetical protein
MKEIGSSLLILFYAALFFLMSLREHTFIHPTILYIAAGLTFALGVWRLIRTLLK